MYERFIDRRDKKNLIKSCPDFKLRRHGTPPVQLVYIFVAVLLAVVTLVGHLTIKLLFLPDSDPTPSGEIMMTLYAIALLIIGVAIFAVILVNKIRDIILETEFQNLIFASSARVGSDFCLIVNADKMVVYCDYNFSEIFSSFKNHADAFKKLLSHEGLKKADKEKLVRALSDGASEKVPFVLTKPNNETRKMSITIDPISRPTGYSIIRGHVQ